MNIHASYKVELRKDEFDALVWVRSLLGDINEGMRQNGAEKVTFDESVSEEPVEVEKLEKLQELFEDVFDTI